MIDVAAVRADTPGADHHVHLNTCGASLMPRPVLDAVTRHLQREALLGGYEAADSVAGEVEAVYDSVARLLGCGRDEVALVENATRAWDMAFYALRFGPGDRILTTTAEYASNFIAFLQVAKRTGAVVEVVPDDASGQLDVAALEAMMDEHVKLVAITHVPTNGGLVNPAAAIGRVTRAHGVPFLLDACQSAGQLPLDVEAMGVDMLSATGRKFLRGPRGTGFLYVRRGLVQDLEPPFLDLLSATWTTPDGFEIRADARRFENFERNVAGLLGLGVAVDYALALGVDAIAARLAELAGRLREGLAALPGVVVRDLGEQPCAIVSFTCEGHEPDAVVAAMRARGFAISASPSRQTLLDMQRRGLPRVLRTGLHCFNTEDEVARFLDSLRELLRGG